MQETKYNIGNTTFGASKAGGTQWCIDHIQGFVYSKVIDPVGAMYYEVDDRSSKLYGAASKSYTDNLAKYHGFITSNAFKVSDAWHSLLQLRLLVHLKAFRSYVKQFPTRFVTNILDTSSANHRYAYFESFRDSCALCSSLP